MSTRHSISIGVRTVVLWALVIGGITRICSPEAVRAECAAAPTGLVAWWRGEGNALDSVTTNNGVLQNGVGFATGKAGHGFLLDGTNDWVGIPSAPALNLTNEITVELWFKSDQLDAGALLDKRDGGTTCNYGVLITTQWGLQLYYNDPNVFGGDHLGNLFEISAHFPVPTPGVFHHFAGTYRQVDAAHIELKSYLDGALIEQRLFSGNLANTVNNTMFTIGAVAGADAFFKGVIDEVSLYNRSLSSNEIAAIHATGSAGKCVTPKPQSFLVNVDFGAGTVSDKTGSAVVGRATNDFWNLFSRDGSDPTDWRIFGTVTNLQQADGTPSGINLSVSNAPGAWGNRAPDPMYASYLYPFNGGNIRLTLDSLPVGQYDFIFYGHGDAPDQNSGFELIVGNLSYGTKATVSGTGWETAVWQEGMQYVVFRNVPISNAAEPITVMVRPAASSYALIAGMQIVAASAAGQPPAITQQPLGRDVAVSDAVTFSVSATGAAPLSYQWRFNEDNLAAATNSTLSLTNVQLAQAGNYSVIISNPFGSVTSSNAVLTVNGVPPTITSQPQDRSVYAGKTVTFSVAVAGSAPFRYQWRKNDAPIANATNASVTLANVQFGDAGLYDVAITNLFGGTTSRMASLTVNPAPACVPVPEGAVAWWPGESNTWDVQGGFDLTPFQPLYAPGVVGSAFKIQPLGYLMAPNLPELNLGTNVGFTVECWVNPDSTFGRIFGWSDASSYPISSTGVNLRNIGGFLEAQLWGTDSSLTVLRTTAPMVQAKAWHHVALTHDRVSGEVNIFYNGVSVARANLGSKVLRTSGYFQLGSQSGSSFYGLIDEPALYKRALSKSEIESIYLADLAGKCPPPPPSCLIPPTDIAAWWRGESNTLDSVAGNHARVIPTNFSVAGTYQAGVVNTALAFRSQNFFSVPRSDNLDLGTASGMTIEAWILPTRSSPMPIVEWTDSNSFGANLWMNFSGGMPVLTANLIDSGGGFHLIQSRTGALGINAWQHVALTYNKASGVAALYVNGNTVVTTNVGSFTPRTDLPLLLGFHPPNFSGGPVGAPPSSTYWFAGAMDEVALYRRALNSQEIRDLSRTRPVKCLDLPPTIGMQPQDQIAMEGGAASLSVVAGGTAPLGYQWFLGGEPIAGATAPALSLPAAALADAGAYTVLVSNALGTAISRSATLTVLPANQCLPTPWGAVAFWRGESNTVDELGNHPAQWASNTVPGYTSRQTGGGKVNTAFRFTRSNHLLVHSNANLNVGAGGGFTVEGWIKLDYYGSYNQPVVDWNDGRGNVGVGLIASRSGPGALEVTLTDTNAVSSTERTVTLTTPNYTLFSPTNFIPPWAHVALTFERVSGRVSLLVNGKIVAERTVGQVTTYASQGQRVPFTPATTGNLYFGYRPSGNYSGYRFQGGMDEMTVYYRALTPLELQAVYVVGANGKCTPQPSCQPVTESVAAWWRAEGDLRDSLFTNNAIAIGMPSYTNGASGAAWRLNGNNYLRVPASPTLNVGASDGLTVEAWVNLASTSSPYAIADWTGQGVTFGSSQTRGPTYLEANFVDTAGRSHLITSPFGAVTNNSWHHVAVIYDKLTGLSALFVNGAPITVTNLGLFTPNTTNQLHLGYRPALGARLIGGLDEVMIHRRALSSSEVTASYRNAANRCMEPPVIVQQPVSQRVNVGSDVTFSVLATGNPLLRYQWFQGRSPVYEFNQKPSTNASKPTLTFTNVAEWRQGAYHCVVSNAFGFAVSSNVTLLVNYAPLADARATVPLHISPNGTDAIAVLDGSRSTDRDRDALSYEWFLNNAITPLSTGMVAVVTLPVGINSITLVVSDGLLVSTNQVTVEVLTTAQAVDRLAALVAGEAANPQPLLASLRAALAAIDRRQPATAINQLEAFINKVRAQVAPVDAELAARLIAEAQAIIDALNGGTAPVAESIEITSITQEGNGKSRLGIRGKAGRTLIIETSTDGVNWEKIGVAADKGAGKFEFDDAQTPDVGARFYRVMSPK